MTLADDPEAAVKSIMSESLRFALRSARLILSDDEIRALVDEVTVSPKIEVSV